MTRIRFVALPTAAVRALQAGGPDANGQPPERVLAEGGGNPCRHCLRMIAPGAPMLILAYRPFPRPQPYAEIGPIFLHAEPCAPATPGHELPQILASPDYILRGYGTNDRIVYGSGGVVARAGIAARAAELLADHAIAYVHVRSTRNNCYQCRVERG
jgi:hypothetical protein